MMPKFTAFVPAQGCVLLSVDYSQVELRLAAEMADVKALKQAFKDDIDIHAHTASQVFGVPLKDVTPDLRRNAKAVNFGIIYGISGWGLAKQLGIDPADANQFIRKYLATFHDGFNERGGLIKLRFRDFKNQFVMHLQQHFSIQTGIGECFWHADHRHFHDVGRGAL